MKWNHQTCHLLKMTFDTNIKELTIQVNMNVIDRCVYKVDEQFMSPTYAWIEEWMGG